MSIDKIPEGQLCQAFDPFMILPEKMINIIDDPMQANTSCVAPAHIYMEGSRGKRFLCDYHYACEAIMTQQRTPHLWKDIEQYLVDERDKIAKTFDFNNDTKVAVGNLCWCGAVSFVLLINKELDNRLYYCNFHYRKTYYRYLSNGRKIEDIFFIYDERNKMKFSIKEEVENIKNLYKV